MEEKETIDRGNRIRNLAVERGNKSTHIVINFQIPSLFSIFRRGDEARTISRRDYLIARQIESVTEISHKIRTLRALSEIVFRAFSRQRHLRSQRFGARDAY